MAGDRGKGGVPCAVRATRVVENSVEDTDPTPFSSLVHTYFTLGANHHQKALDEMSELGTIRRVCVAREPENSDEKG